MKTDINTLPPQVPRTCEQCGKAFEVPRKVITRAIRNGEKPRPYCSQRCYRITQQTQRIARFWSKVTKSDGCWTWGGHGLPSGYGILSSGATGKILAHRFSFQIQHGPIPEGMKVCHRCDNPPCVRAECSVLNCQHLKDSEDCKSHLFLGTTADNNDDMYTKGRAAIGDRHSNAKLSEEQVKEIRRRYVWRKVTTVMLAKEFSVHAGTILKIVHGTRWKHLLLGE